MVAAYINFFCIWKCGRDEFVNNHQFNCRSLWEMKKKFTLEFTVQLISNLFYVPAYIFKSFQIFNS